jgi:translation initiation factor IF-3
VWIAGTGSVAAFFCGQLNWRCFRISNKGHQLNEEIRDKEVRLVGEDGEQLGIMSAREALEKAAEQSLDLVKISPTAVPPVCKLMDYGKYRFEQQKREKEARKNQHVVEIKEVRMSPGIDVNDFNVKLRNAQKFLAEGDRVKVTVRFRGREMAHTDIGRGLLLKFAEQCTEVAVLDKDPKLDGRHMSIFLSPKVGKDAKESKKSTPPTGE